MPLLLQLIPEEVIASSLAACFENNFDRVQSAANDTVLSGYPVNQVLTQVTP